MNGPPIQLMGSGVEQKGVIEQSVDLDLKEFKNFQKIERWTSDRRVCFKTNEGYIFFNQGDEIDQKYFEYPYIASSELNIPLIKASEFVKKSFEVVKFQDQSENVFSNFDDFEIVVSVSHKWLTEQHPDPEGKQLIEIQNYVKNQLNGKELRKIGIFYDFICLPQYPRSEKEEKQFNKSLNRMNQLYILSERIFICSAGFEDYYRSSWCVFESIMGLFSGSLMNKRTEMYQSIELEDLDNSSTKNDITKKVDKIISKTKATNGSDKEIIKTLLVEIMIEGKLWDHEFKRHKFRPQLELKWPRTHGASFTMTFTTKQVNVQQLKFGLNDHEVEQITQAMITDKYCTPCNRKCLACALCPVVTCYCSPLCAKCIIDKINAKLSDEITDNIANLGFSLTYSTTESYLQVNVYKKKFHRINYNIKSHNIEGEVTELIKHSYGGMINFVSKCNSGSIDAELAFLMIKMNSIDFEISDELYKDS